MTWTGTIYKMLEVFYISFPFRDGDGVPDNSDACPFNREIAKQDFYKGYVNLSKKIDKLLCVLAIIFRNIKTMNLCSLAQAAGNK